jgi:tetratricopeptide (TPR) repeat protein
MFCVSAINLRSENIHEFMTHRASFLLLIVIGITFYGLVVFRVLPEIHLVKYWHAADLLIHGKLNGERILDFSPLYLYLNVLLLKAKTSHSFLLCLQILCVSVSAGLLYEILRQYFSAIIALIAAIVFMTDRGLVVFTNTFEPEPLVILFILSSVTFLCRESMGSAFAGAVCLALGIWTRPNFLPVLAFIPFWYYFNSPQTQWKKKTALFLIPAILSIFLLWVRNAFITGYFSPFVMDPGTVFYEGNNPNSWGMSSIYPPVLNQFSEAFTHQPDYHHQLYRDFARSITQKQLTLPEVNSYWILHALYFLSDHRTHAMILGVTKSFHIFDSFQWHDLASSYLIETALRNHLIPTVPFGIVSSLGLCGFFIMLKNWKKLLIFYAISISQFCSMLATYVSARQRVAILFLFIFFACGAIEFLIHNRKRWLLLIVFFPLVVLFTRKTDLMKEENHLWENTLQSAKYSADAYSLRVQGRMEEAGENAARSLALTPWLLDSKRPANLYFQKGYLQSAIDAIKSGDRASQFDLGVLLLQNRQPDHARKIFAELIAADYHLKRDDQQSSNLQYYLGQCDLLENRTESAIRHFESGISQAPGDPWLLSYLIALTNKQEFHKQLFRYFDDIDAQFFLGKAYLGTGQPSKAADCFQFVVEKIPQFRKAYIYLAASLTESGQYELAATMYRKAIRLAPDPVFQEQQILQLFRRIAEKQRTPYSRYSYGVVLRQFGKYREALEQQEEAIARDTSNPEVQREIVMLKRVIQIQSK